MAGYLPRRGVFAAFGVLSKSSDFLRAHKSYRLSSPAARNYSYEGDGKTTVTVLNKEPDAPLMIDAYSSQGFRLNNGMHVIGPMAIFPKSVLAWNVRDIHDINVKSLSLFFTLEPKLDILIIGCGNETAIDLDAFKEIRKKGLNLEILQTEYACTTFNFLNVENRAVAAAMIPPVKIQFVDDDILKNQRKRKQLFMDADN